jgi:hypothetical protein
MKARYATNSPMAHSTKVVLLAKGAASMDMPTNLETVKEIAKPIIIQILATYFR